MGGKNLKLRATVEKENQWHLDEYYNYIEGEKITNPSDINTVFLNI